MKVPTKLLEIWPWWRHGAITIIIGITGLMCMGRQVSQNTPFIFAKAINSKGQVVFDQEDVLGGQGVFQKYGLMDMEAFSGMVLTGGRILRRIICTGLRNCCVIFMPGS